MSFETTTHALRTGRIAVTGSVAFDNIMVFRGRFADHILPGKTHIINVAFLVDSLERRRGGTAANICHTLALLGEHPLLCAAVGADDFDGYGEALREEGVDVGPVLRCAGVTTASAYITTDLDDNQITAFFPGAMSHAADVDLAPLPEVGIVVVGADGSEGMALHIRQAGELGARLVFAPAQQIPALSDEALRAGLEAAWLVVGNDYELAMIRERTGLDVETLRTERTVAVTKGGLGSELHDAQGTTVVPPAPVAEVVDPTGAGDAYVAGLLHGLRRGLPLATAGRMAAVAGAFAVECRGPQGHSFTMEAFQERFRVAYGEPLPQSAPLPS